MLELLLILCAFFILCPPKYDPLIRWKEHNERRRRELERRK